MLEKTPPVITGKTPPVPPKWASTTASCARTRKGADPQLSHSRKVEVLKSEIAMQTRNPHYDEHFKLAINEDADTLLVQAWGREYGGSYGLIGRVLIRVNEIEEEEWEPGVEERRRYVQLLHHHRRLIIASMHAIR